MSFDKERGALKVVGHGHTALVAPPVYQDVMTEREGKAQIAPVAVKPEWCAMCPSFLATYDDGGYPGYGELALYPPTDIGWLECEIARDGSVADVRARIVR